MSLQGSWYEGDYFTHSVKVMVTSHHDNPHRIAEYAVGYSKGNTSTCLHISS